MGTLVPKALPERRRALQNKTKRYNPALAMGAVCADGALVLNHELIPLLNIGGARLDDVIAVERAKSQRLDKAYRNDALRLELRDKFAILVDDGMTTASAMRTAIAILRLRHPARIVIAVPVASHSSVLDLLAQVDKVITIQCQTCAQHGASVYRVPVGTAPARW
jgi:putative phosphoribosyl transferase